MRLTFELEPGKEGDFRERANFWDSQATVNWFKAHGYTLYQRVLDDDGDPTSWVAPTFMPSQGRVEAQYPYAYHDTEVVNQFSIPLREEVFYGKVAFAQDSLNRHVAIKIVKNDSNEYRILKFLMAQGLEALRENCIIPVLDLLPAQDISFAVMPRWGSDVMHPPLQTVHQLLLFMHCMLKDIKAGNVLTNHFSDSCEVGESIMRQELRSKGLLSYVIFDFDFSIQWPSELDRTTCRLPYYRAWGSFNLVTDVAQGEFDYNPFIFDVGVLGALFCKFAQHLTGNLPMLAPLLDRMTTRELARRFTAVEALRFFEEMKDQLSQHDLDQSLEKATTISRIPYYSYDRWKDIPPEFAERWAAFREPPIPLMVSIMRRICRYGWVCHVVARIRWFFFKISSIPRCIKTTFVGLRVS
ncbi:hypothetical protein CVT26_006751 [Gymnopilus dilepis]|uniref:Protein kinase domain-containing protein n=1 Tax=Gymnopilus dilepis TaxID=231916 RepID=A0A409W1K7_9AGAR|nr:hypothetical protein CVT26_006751 [Gymnopilus dilepis]